MSNIEKQKLTKYRKMKTNLLLLIMKIIDVLLMTSSFTSSHIQILTIVLILVANWLITQLFTEYLHVLRDDLVYEL